MHWKMFNLFCALLSLSLLLFLSFLYITFFQKKNIRIGSLRDAYFFRQGALFFRGKWMAPDGCKLKVDHHPHLVFCIHQRLKIQCIPCGGQRVCPHGRQKTECDWIAGDHWMISWEDHRSIFHYHLWLPEGVTLWNWLVVLNMCVSTQTAWENGAQLTLDHQPAKQLLFSCVLFMSVRFFAHSWKHVWW